MTNESRLSRLEGAYEQVNERLADHIERFADISRRLDRLYEEIQGVRGEVQGLREETNANHAALRAETNANISSVRGEVQGLREEMNANIAGVRRESRWIGGIIIAGIVVTVISVIIQPLL